jgi:hypothetical protein
MTKKIILLSLFCLLVACAGPVQVARNESEVIKTGYLDPQSKALSVKYAGVLKSIYTKYRLAKVSFAKEGLGFTSLTDTSGQKFYYLKVEIRPSDLNFDQNTTIAEDRLRAVLKRYFEPALRMLNKDDVAHDDTEGVAFGVQWPVRDFSQCNSEGGFVEYVIAYISTNDFLSVLEGSETLSNVLANSEVVVSLDLKPEKSVKLRY